MHLPGYVIAPIRYVDIAALQAMLESDPAYFAMIQGAPAACNEAENLAADLPAGRTPADKFALLVRDSTRRLCAVIDLVRGYPEPRIWFLGLLFVAPHARGGGLGTRQLQAICAHAEEQGGAALRLGVLQANTRARSLYDRNGFRFLLSRERQLRSNFRVLVDLLERRF